MPQVRMHESDIEEAALHWFEELGYSVAYGPDLLPDGLFQERDERTVVLSGQTRGSTCSVEPGASSLCSR